MTQQEAKEKYERLLKIAAIVHDLDSDDTWYNDMLDYMDVLAMLIRGVKEKR
jgi:hypothetical protein